MPLDHQVMPQQLSWGAAHVASYLTALTAASRTPGIQYLAATPTGVLFEHYSGWADICRRMPVNAATTLMAYSMSKTITAAAVLQLVETGRVGLDDPLQQYVDALPYGPNVTVRQLICHTSGIPNPLPLRWVHPAERHGNFDEDASLATVLRDHPRLSFEPGTRYAYSNIGYWLLGKTVEHVTGRTFSSYVTEHILRPLAIEPRELGYAVADPACQATGYLEKYSLMNLVKGALIDRDLVGDYAGRWLAIRSHYLNGSAFGGLVGSVRGFGKFLQDQLRDRSVLLANATRQMFYTQQQTTRGRAVPMTLGWHIGVLDGLPFFYKEGGGGGFHCMMRLYPGKGIGTVVMTNATAFDVRDLLDTADASFLRRMGPLMQTVEPMAHFTEPDPADRSAFNRLFYRNRRPTWLGHWVSQFFCWWARVGLPPRSWVALEVRDRVSGRPRADAVVVPTVEGERYVVSMFGTLSDWVHNIEAAQGEAVIAHGGSLRVRLVAVAPEERAPILREYVRIASSGRKHFPLPVGAPFAEFAAIAAQYPVYRIETPAA